MAETDPNATIDQVAELMDEYRLSEARLQMGGFAISFRRRPTPRTESSTRPTDGEPEPDSIYEWFPPEVAVEEESPKGMPILSPMNGIFYAAPNPGSPPFVRPGDEVTVGQTVGLIEAMKVFNEIPAPIGGMVVEVVAHTAQIVNPGDVLLYVEVGES